MPYTAPTTVSPGTPIASALHNTLAADIVDHESRIGTVTTTLTSLPYAKLASSARNYTILNYSEDRDVASSDADNKILVSGSTNCGIYGAGNVLVEGQIVNLFRGGTGLFFVHSPSYLGTTINGTTDAYYLNPYGFAQLICIGTNSFILVGNFGKVNNV